MKYSFTIWRTNLIIGVTICSLAVAAMVLLVQFNWADWKTAGLLMAQANFELFVIYYISTQSRGSIFAMKSLAFVLARQLVFAAIYTFILLETWQYFFPNNFYFLIPSNAFWLLFLVSSVILTSLGAIHYLVVGLIEQEQRILLENGVQQLKNEAELFKLRQQLHPHFLFNSLNSINALIGSEPQQARTMLIKLSAFLRHTLRKEDDQQVSLQSELEELDLYLDIEKVRFGDRLIIFKEVPESLGDKMIPPFLLQPLVENAIKFGLYDTLGTVIIRISVRETEHFYSFEISNPFEKDSLAPKGTGFGLSGISRRLYLLYARNDLLQIEKVVGLVPEEVDTYIARLLIPKESVQDL